MRKRNGRSKDLGNISPTLSLDSVSSLNDTGQSSNPALVDKQRRYPKAEIINFNVKAGMDLLE